MPRRDPSWIPRPPWIPAPPPDRGDVWLPGPGWAGPPPAPEYQPPPLARTVAELLLTLFDPGASPAMPTPTTDQLEFLTDDAMRRWRPRRLSVSLGVVSPVTDLPAGDTLDGLRASVRQFGVLFPVVLRAAGAVYQVIDGRRRIRVAHALGLDTIPAIIFPENTPDAVIAALTLTGNVHRSANPLAEADAVRSLTEQGWSTERIARQMRLPARYVDRRQALAYLMPAWRGLLVQGRIAVGIAERVGALPRDQQRRLWTYFDDPAASPTRRFTQADLDVWLDAERPADEQATLPLPEPPTAPSEPVTAVYVTRTDNSGATVTAVPVRESAGHYRVRLSEQDAYFLYPPSLQPDPSIVLTTTTSGYVILPQGQAARQPDGALLAYLSDQQRSALLPTRLAVRLLRPARSGTLNGEALRASDGTYSLVLTEGDIVTLGGSNSPPQAEAFPVSVVCGSRFILTNANRDVAGDVTLALQSGQLRDLLGDETPAGRSTNADAAAALAALRLVITGSTRSQPLVEVTDAMERQAPGTRAALERLLGPALLRPNRAPSWRVPYLPEAAGAYRARALIQMAYENGGTHVLVARDEMRETPGLETTLTALLGRGEDYAHRQPGHMRWRLPLRASANEAARRVDDLAEQLRTAQVANRTLTERATIAETTAASFRNQNLRLTTELADAQNALPAVPAVDVVLPADGDVARYQPGRGVESVAALLVAALDELPGDPNDEADNCHQAMLEALHALGRREDGQPLRAATRAPRRARPAVDPAPGGDATATVTTTRTPRTRRRREPASEPATEGDGIVIYSGETLTVPSGSLLVIDEQGPSMADVGEAINRQVMTSAAANGWADPSADPVEAIREAARRLREAYPAGTFNGARGGGRSETARQRLEGMADALHANINASAAGFAQAAERARTAAAALAQAAPAPVLIPHTATSVDVSALLDELRAQQPADSRVASGRTTTNIPAGDF